MIISILLIVFLSGCDKNSQTNNVRRQSFNVTNVYPICEAEETMDYQVLAAFSIPIKDEDAIKIFDDAVIKKYEVTAEPVDENVHRFTLRYIPRKAADYDIDVTLNGKNIGADSKANIKLNVYAKDKFAPISLDVEKSSGQATIFFSKPLKQGQNFNGLITFSEKKLAGKYDIKDNRIILYFDKSSLNSYQLENIVMTVSGIRSASDDIMQEDAEFTFSLNNYEPKVRWTNDGVILPDIKGTTV